MAIPQPPSKAAPHPDQGTWNHSTIPESLIRLSRANLITRSTRMGRRLAGNRATAGKAVIVARQMTIVTAFQFDFDMLTVW